MCLIALRVLARTVVNPVAQRYEAYSFWIGSTGLTEVAWSR